MSLLSAWAPHFVSEVRQRGNALAQRRGVERLPSCNGELVRARVLDLPDEDDVAESTPASPWSTAAAPGSEGPGSGSPASPPAGPPGSDTANAGPEDASRAVPVADDPDAEVDADPDADPDAQVDGDEDAAAPVPSFEVQLAEEDGRVHATCECLLFRGGRYCEHLWALLVDVENRGGLGQTERPLRQMLSELGAPGPPKARRRAAARGTGATRRVEPEWVGRLNLLRPSRDQLIAPRRLRLDPKQLCFVVMPDESMSRSRLVLELRERRPVRGGWGRMRRASVRVDQAATLDHPLDRELLSLLFGATPVAEGEPTASPGSGSVSRFALPPGPWRSLLRRLSEAGRGFMARDDAEPSPVTWDDGDAWRLWLTGERTEDGELIVDVELRRGEERLDVRDPTLLLGGVDGVLVHQGVAAPFDDGDAYRWVTQYRDDLRTISGRGAIRVPEADIDRFLERLYRLPHLPDLDLPPGMGRREVTTTPDREVQIFSPGRDPDVSGASRQTLTARVQFVYGSQRLAPDAPGQYVMPDDPDTPLIRRDEAAEREALASLVDQGLRPVEAEDGLVFTLPTRQFGDAVEALMAGGWSVQADDHDIRRAATPHFSVRAGVDWFELRGGVAYETGSGQTQMVALPKILAAARAGQTMITLDDGSQGLLPSEWLAEHGMIAAIGEVRDEAVRFKATQATLLDALLAKDAEIDVDARFDEMRQRLTGFQSVEPRDPAPSFHGTLRGYQREALGWMAFLRWLGMGGILADDMGLGKTVQVLAMLDRRIRHMDRSAPGSPLVSEGVTLGDGIDVASAPPASAAINATPDGDGIDPDEARIPHRPSLIVAPRSVVFNWVDEAQRFTPDLRVEAYHGGERDRLLAEFDRLDILVTSYALLRRDVEELVDRDFDYVVLDEAQAIKNPKSQAAQASRLLRARARLALTGTPIENHLGDLWSIIEFLNPGLLGSNVRFARLVRRGLVASGVNATNKSDANRDAGDDDAPPSRGGRPPRGARQAALPRLAEALRPFILRRTKQQVLSELPPKTEQTLVCELAPDQRRIYDDLLKHYRHSLLKQVDQRGIGHSTMMVLEALLRLRQVACHPGLIDPAHRDASAGKLDALLEHLRELVDEGHKALVFSQFTAMLGIVRARLDQADLPYEYLDGQTRRREQVVQRFQQDQEKQVFLISLKAGGLGLNLTAADYVFILDPWWNPAVEAQAIDRAHRIGQTRHVFAYRLISENTVEQRIVELQQRKRRLADAIVGGQDSLLQDLSRDDLERLLS